MLKHYESIAALRSAYLTSNLRDTSHSIDWYGGETREDTIRFAEIGDTRLVAKAETLLTSLDTQIETPRRVWTRSPAGAFCSVPDVLAGLPTPMRRQLHEADETAPITILATTTSSAAIPAETLAKRGTVILALVMALARIRPVSLHQLTLLNGSADRTGETVITAQINTSPLDLATACYVLTSAGFARRMTYRLAEKLNASSGGWPSSFSYWRPQAYYDGLIPRLGFKPADTLLIGAAQLGDALLVSPVEWVNAQIARFLAKEED